MTPLTGIDRQIHWELSKLLDMSCKDVFEKIGKPLFMTDEGFPLYCKTNFKQQAVAVIEVDEKQHSNFQTERAWYNEDQVKKEFVESNLIKHLFPHDDFRINNNKHFFYGLSPKEGVFISNIEVILVYLRNKLLLEEDTDIYLFHALNEQISKFKEYYRTQLLLYTPILPTTTMQNRFQTLTESLNEFFNNKTNPKITPQAISAVCSIIYFNILNNPKFENNNLIWLSDQIAFIPSFIAKRSYIHFLEVQDTLHNDHQVNPALSAEIELYKEHSNVKDISIVKMLIKQFLEFEAAKIILSGNANLIDLIHFKNRTLGKLVENFTYLNVTSPNDPQFKDFIYFAENLLSSRLALNQKFNN